MYRVYHYVLSKVLLNGSKYSSEIYIIRYLPMVGLESRRIGDILPAHPCILLGRDFLQSPTTLGDFCRPNVTILLEHYSNIVLYNTY